MSYSPPAYNAADFQFAGGAYSPPIGTAAHFAWPVVTTVAVQVQTSATSPLGAASATVGALVTVEVRTAASTPLGATTALARPVTVATAQAASPLGSCKAAASVLRYELRGEVRQDGVLINRRVRAYLRSTGELVGEVDTTVGAFAIPAGFSAQEFYLTPINLDDSATDWLPPTANRIMSVLALDVA